MSLDKKDSINPDLKVNCILSRDLFPFIRVVLIVIFLKMSAL